MKTPEEIKRGLDMCHCDYEECDTCSLADLCNEKAQGLAYIQQLERDNEQKDERIRGLEREREAAVADLSVTKDCKVCKYVKGAAHEEPCRSCGIVQHHWEWRGVEEANES